MKEIKFCENNYQFETDKVKEELEALEGFNVEEEGCCGYCGECNEGPYALVDDEVVTAENAEELLEKIKEM